MTCQRDPHRLIQQFQHFAEFLLLIFVPTDPNARYAMCVCGCDALLHLAQALNTGWAMHATPPLEYVTHTCFE